MRRIAVLATSVTLFAACWYEVADVEPDAAGAAGAAGASAGGASSAAEGGAGTTGGEASTGGALGGSGGEGQGGSMPAGDFLDCDLLGYEGMCVGNQLLVYFSAAHPCNRGSASGHCFLNRCSITGTCGVVTCDGSNENAVCLPEQSPGFLDCAIDVSAAGDCIDGVAVRRDGVSCRYNDCLALGATCKQPPEVELADCYR